MQALAGLSLPIPDTFSSSNLALSHLLIPIFLMTVAQFFPLKSCSKIQSWSEYKKQQLSLQLRHVLALNALRNLLNLL